MTKENYEALKKYESILNGAKSNFARVSRSELREINVLYKSVLGKELNNTQMNCNHCVLGMLKALASEYETYGKRVKAMERARAAKSVQNSNQEDKKGVEVPIELVEEKAVTNNE